MHGRIVRRQRTSKNPNPKSIDAKEWKDNTRGNQRRGVSLMQKVARVLQKD